MLLAVWWAPCPPVTFLKSYLGSSWPWLLHLNFKISPSPSIESLTGTSTLILLCVRALWGSTSGHGVSARKPLFPRLLHFCQDALQQPVTKCPRRWARLGQVHPWSRFECYQFSSPALLEKWYCLSYVHWLLSCLDTLWSLLIICLNMLFGFSGSHIICK